MYQVQNTAVGASASSNRSKVILLPYAGFIRPVVANSQELLQVTSHEIIFFFPHTYGGR